MKTVDIRRDGHVVTVAMNRPEQHNAFDPRAVADLTAAFRRLADDAMVRAVILTGRGRSFCAGADLNFMRAAADYSEAQNAADGQAIYDLMEAVDRFPRPVIGRINGAAIGGGAGLVCCCDEALAISRARFAFSEARLGIVPAVISPFVIARVGAGHARRLFLSGERFDANHALRIGMVHAVLDDEAALDEAIALRLDEYLQAAPGAQAAVKELVRAVTALGPEELLPATSRRIAERRAC